MSRSRRPSATTSWPARSAAAHTSLPSIPAAPVTSSRTRSICSGRAEPGPVAPVIEERQQVAAVAALDERLGQPAQVLVADEALAPGDLLGRADPQPLALLDHPDELRRPH